MNRWRLATDVEGLAAFYARILRVADLGQAIEAVKANGGTLMREPGRNAVMNLRYAFVKDPDGNQIELIMEAQ